MFKSHSVISVIFGIAFLILISELSSPRPIFRFLVLAFIVFLLVITAYNRWYLKSIGKYNFWTLLRPVLFYGSAFALFHVIPVDFLKGVFLILTVLLGAFFEAFIGSFAENILINETLVTAFSLCMAISAYALQYFPSFEVLYLLMLFAGIMVTVRTFYEFTPESGSKKAIASLSIALFCTQAFWAFSFLPLHFSAIGLMLFNVLYFCVILNYYFIFNTLNVRKFQFHLVLLGLTSIFILLLTPWGVLN